MLEMTKEELIRTCQRLIREENGVARVMKFLQEYYYYRNAGEIGSVEAQDFYDQNHKEIHEKK